MWIVAGTDFVSESGQCMLVNKALYGLKSSGAAFMAHLTETLGAMGYNPSYAYPDECIFPSRNTNVFE